MEIKGKIVANEIAHCKFGIGGKLASVNCKVGDQVKKGQLLASLDKAELQKYLDRALKQYDLERAEFDEKQKDSLNEYDKRKNQDRLDISVMNVEIAKANLDAANLHSSIYGIVTEIETGYPGDNITPAGFVITVCNPDSLCFFGEATEENLSQIVVGEESIVQLNAFASKELPGKIESVSFVPDNKGNYRVEIELNDLTGLRVGLTGKALLN